MVTLSNFVNGSSLPTYGQLSKVVLDPSTGSAIAQLPLSRSVDIDCAVQASTQAFAGWRLLSMKHKSSIILKLALLVESNTNELASLITLESGRNLQESLLDVAKCVEILEWAINLPQFSMGSQYELTREVSCQETRQSIGVVAAILPFSSLGKEKHAFPQLPHQCSENI